VFAYGQTSSGKTHTMKGYPSNNEVTGLIPLSVDHIFKVIGASDRKYSISVSYIEIYNESVNDLIEPSNKNLEVRESITAGIYINRLSEKNVGNFREVMAFMDKGDECRNIAATKLNELSSRSHTVFRININSEENGKIKLSQLNLVDLAGSEGASKT
jgi:centromeric protein E